MSKDPTNSYQSNKNTQVTQKYTSARRTHIQKTQQIP